jgi:hypothetical protein
LHVPAVEGDTSHEAPAPHAAAEQQTPSTHCPRGHCEPVVHGTPSPCNGTHDVPLQKVPGEQSVSVAHVVLQPALFASHSYAPQLPVDAEQLPLPSQMPAVVNDALPVVLSVHVVAPHALVVVG